MKKLKALTNLLFETEDKNALKQIAIDLSNQLEALVAFKSSEKLANKKFITNGSAITSAQAIDCIKDVQRTKLFLQATIDAIEEKKLKKINKPIKVLYAGCGPFAPFCILSILHKDYSPNDIQFDLLEINPYSINLLKILLDKLNYNQYISTIQEVDCTTCTIKDKYDIFITETMDAALQHESMFYVMKNIIPQLHDETLIIPENVLLYVSTWTNKRNDVEFLSQTPLMDLKETILKGQYNSVYPSKYIEVPSIGSISIDTRIIVKNQYILYENQCAITRKIMVDTSKRNYNYSYSPTTRKWMYI